MSDGLVAQSTQTYRINLNEDEAAYQTTTLKAENVAQPTKWQRGKKTAPTKRYLVLGFDTEYQSHETVTKDDIKDEDVEIHNEILSYQYSIKIITDNAEVDASLTAEGIIIPDNGELLDLPSFIAFALGDFIQKHPREVIPENIFLVAHFTRADLPGFSGFTDIARGYLSNIRNTFVSLGVYIPLEINTADDVIAKFKVRLRDTVLLAPANAKKLADVGEIVGLEKIILGNNQAEDFKIKSSGMKQLRDEQWEVFRPYAIRDAEICVRYSEKLMRQNQIISGNLELPVTLTSFGVHMVRQDWAEKGWDINAVLGKEQIQVKSYSKKAGRFVFKKETPYIECVHYEAELAVESFHGGRNEQFMFGICNEAVWRDHDLSSAYTTAMSVIGMPDWHNIETITNLKNINQTDLAIFWVEFEFPKRVRFPTLPVRCDGGIIFPRKGLSRCAAPEILLAKRLNAKLKIKKAVYVPTDAQTPIFKDFIVKCIANRAEHPKGSFDNLFWKEIGNSTYGKTAQGMRRKRVYDMRSDDMVVLPESKLTQPFFASFITSYTRAVLGEILNGFSKNVDVFSVTTDGFLSNADDEELKTATSGELFNSFEKARGALDNGSKALEIKHEIKRPIGWRTRGSATLVPGDGKDGILLQKGGIKVDYNYTTEQENHFIIDMFLNRFPDQKLDYTIGIGLKDMISYGADFVSRSITKRLSMEYDWKRKPVLSKNVKICFDSKDYEHLSFKTIPLESKDEFDQIRSDWDNYTRGKNNDRILLKTLDDLEQFQNYRLYKQNPHGSKRGYVPKTDADYKKLKASLTRAFKQNAAGFTGKLNGKKITHKLFLEQMKECGLTCTISDLDNAKRFPFEPHTAGYTTRAAKAAEKLQKKFYPNLDLSIVFDENYKNK